MENDNKKKEDNALYKMLGNVNYNKAYAVGQYVNGLGLSIAEMMQRGDHREYAWNSGNKNNPHREEMLEAIHKKAMEAINSL